MSDMITIIAASSDKELKKRLSEIKRNHEARNPGREVEVKVIKPEPDKVKYTSEEATQFTISVEIKAEEVNSIHE